MAERKVSRTIILKKQLALSNQSHIIKAQNEKLEKKNREIEVANTELESRVKERTQSLIAAQKRGTKKPICISWWHDMKAPVMSLIGLCKLLNAEGKIEPYTGMILRYCHFAVV
ncbi:MAG: hypothetical protein U5K54_04740 [Cytophagales bacterium]|nr:hypothetical protein [Cytophagales bacterium]